MNHSFNIPTYIEASTPSGLRLLMLNTNNKHGKMFKYFDIQTYVNTKGKTRWIAWYYSDISDLQKEASEAI